MNIRRYILFPVVAAVNLLLALSLHAGYTNIVVFVADDMGWADIGFNNPAVYTPTLDALAAGGVRFERHYVMSQCTPTRVALFTGRYPSRSGTQAQQASNVQSFPHGTLTLSSMLNEMGYESFMAGKWHMGSAPEWGPNYHGFDESYGSLTGAVGMYDHRYRPGDAYEITWHHDHTIIPGYENGVHATDLTAGSAVRFIEKNRDKPFFLYLPFHAPHTPLDERGSFTNRPTQRDPDNSLRWLNEDEIEWFNDPAGKIQSESDPEKRLLLATVYHLDSAISNVVAALDRSGQRDSTIIFFSSDNGPQVNWSGNAYPDDLNLTDFNQPDDLRGYKTDVYEGGIQVPGFVNWPARIVPGVVTNPVHIVDWLPTIADMVDYTPPPGTDWDGENIMPLIEGTGALGDRPLYWLWGSDSSRWAVRYGDWKVVKYGAAPVSASDWQLFNLSDDPREKTNLASTASAKLNEMHALFVVERDKDLQGNIVSPRLIGPVAAGSSFAVQLTFTASVTGLGITDFIYNNCSGFSLSGSGTSYNLSVDSTITTNGVVSLVLPAGAAVTSGGVTNSPSNELQVSVDMTPPTADILSGLISHLPFDTDGSNRVKGAPDGMLTGGAVISLEDPVVGDGCLMLDGIGDYVDCSTAGLPNNLSGLSEGTLSLWVKTTGTSLMVMAGTLNQADSTAFLWQLHFDGVEDKSRLLVRDRNDGAGTQQFDSVLDVNDGGWHHIAISWGLLSSDARMYRDGVRMPVSFVSDKNSTVGALFTAWQYAMTIGARNNRGSLIDYFNGCIDDVRIYSRVLEEYDIQRLVSINRLHPGSIILVK